MTEVHQIAARGFGAQAGAYDNSRPSYPAEAVGWLTDALGIGPGKRVVDLAAGTGKLTALIAESNADLIAVEPVPTMGERLRHRLPAVPLVAGVAEELPLGASSVDAVVVGQAFHWFDAPRALAELARVVRVGGGIGLIWNSSDRSTDWIDRIWAIMDRVESSAPWRERNGRGLPAHETADWSAWTEATFSHVQSVTHDQVIERMRSVSHVAALPQVAQREVLDEIATILREHPDTRDSATVEIPYRVEAMYAARHQASG